LAIIFNQDFTVLIVDDAPDIIDLTRVILEDQGIGCIAAEESARALTIAREGRVDLIILDILMPHPDGFEVCRQLKADPLTKDIPVIFITAKGDDDSIAKGFEYGAVDYIPKPFNRYEMLSRVETHLRIIAQRKELNTIIGVKDRVLSIIAHEIRNQFASLMSVYELFKDEVAASGNSALGSHLSRLSSGLSETHDLFDNLITWSKNQRGKLKVSPARIHVYSVVQEIANALFASLENKEITLENLIDPALFILADELLVSLILRNFTTNAIKFSHRGGTIEILDGNADGKTVVTVRDYGTGIDPGIRELLFDIEKNPTTQGTEKEKGTGIGLIICKDFADSIGGEISFASEYGKGASFSLLLPAGAVG
jgi:two-component system sensor histidine kinase/response regulator